MDRSTASPFKRILVAVDGSDNSRRAADAAIGIASAGGSELIVMTVVPIPVALVTGMSEGGIAPNAMQKFYEQADQKAKALLDVVISDARKRGVAARYEIYDKPVSPVEAIVTTASARGADLLVLGTRGLGGFKKMLMGSVSSGVLAHAPCSVMIVR